MQIAGRYLSGTQLVLREKIALLDAASFRFKPKDSTLVELGMDIFRACIESEDIERVKARAMVNDLRSRKLLSMSGLLAEEALHSRGLDMINASICMHAIEDFRWDYRESYRYLVLSNYAARTLGRHLVDLVKDVEPMFSVDAKKYMRQFCVRDESFNRLGAFGVEVKEVAGRVRFVPLA